MIATILNDENNYYNGRKLIIHHSYLREKFHFIEIAFVNYDVTSNCNIISYLLRRCNKIKISKKPWWGEQF